MHGMKKLGSHCAAYRFELVRIRLFGISRLKRTLHARGADCLAWRHFLDSGEEAYGGKLRSLRSKRYITVHFTCPRTATVWPLQRISPDRMFARVARARYAAGLFLLPRRKWLDAHRDDPHRHPPFGAFNAICVLARERRHREGRAFDCATAGLMSATNCSLFFGEGALVGVLALDTTLS